MERETELPLMPVTVKWEPLRVAGVTMGKKRIRSEDTCGRGETAMAGREMKLLGEEGEDDVATQT